MFKRFIVSLCFIIAFIFSSGQAQVARLSSDSSKSVSSLQKSFESLVLSGLQEFGAPLISSLKPLVLQQVSASAKQVLESISNNSANLGPDIANSLQGPAKILVSLTSDLIPKLRSMPSMSVDNFFEQIDQHRDILKNLVKALDIAPGSSSDKSIKSILSAVGGLDRILQVFQGDIVSELGKRLEKLQTPISTAAKKMLEGLSPEVVEKILEPLKSIQGEIADDLKKELEEFRKVIIDRLPESLIDSIKLRLGLLIKKVDNDQGSVSGTVKEKVKNLRKYLNIFDLGVKSLLKDKKDDVAKMRQDLAEIGKEVPGDAKSDVNELTKDLNAVNEIVLSEEKSKDKKTSVDDAKAKFKEVFKGLRDKFGKSKKEVSEKSKEVVNQLTSENIVDIQSGESGSQIFSDLSDGAIIAIRTDKQSPGRGRYLCITDNGMLKPTGVNKEDKSCQFIVTRFGEYLGLLCVKSIASTTKKYLQCDAQSGKIHFNGQEFYKDSADLEHFIPVGKRIDSVYLKNQKTGGFLSVRKEEETWSFGGCVMASDSNGNPSGPSNWGRFAFEIVKHPDEPVAQWSDALKDLTDGTLVAIKSLKNSSKPRYLKVVDSGKFKDFVRADGTSSSDPNCQFYIKRSDNWIGFKWRGWTSLCSQPSSHRVKFIHKSDSFASPLEHWEFHQKDDKSFQGWLQGRASGGYLTNPQDDSINPWTNGLLWTAFAQVENPLSNIIQGMSKFKMEPAGRGNNGLIEIEIIKKVPGNIVGGESSFSFIPALHGKNEVLFHKNWRFPSGNLELVLKNISAEDSIFINLSPAFGKSTEGLRILLGKDENKSSSLRQGNETFFDEKDKSGSVIEQKNASFWIRLKDGSIAVGKGTEFDKNIIFNINRGSDKTGKLEYLGLGGSIYPVTYGSIEMNKIEENIPVPPVIKPQEEKSEEKDEPVKQQPEKDILKEEQSESDKKQEQKLEDSDNQEEFRDMPSLSKKTSDHKPKDSVKKVVKKVVNEVKKKNNTQQQKNKKKRAIKKIKKRRKRIQKRRRQKQRRKRINEQRKKRIANEIKKRKALPKKTTFIQGAQGVHRYLD